MASAEAEPGPRIRWMTEADLPEVLEIEEASFGDPWPIAAFTDFMGGPPWWSLVLEGPAGGVAGYAVMGILFEQAELENFAIRPELRGSGLGRELLEAVVALARSGGADQLFLEVRASNAPARALYHARGFREIGVRKNYYAHPREDARVLVLDLSSGAGPGGVSSD